MKKNIYNIKVKNTNGYWANFKKNVEATPDEIVSETESLNERFPEFEYAPEIVVDMNKTSEVKVKKPMNSEEEILMLLSEEESRPQNTNDTTSEDIDLDFLMDDEELPQTLHQDTSETDRYALENLLSDDIYDWEPEEDPNDTSEFPRGWHRRNKFVTKHGTYYEKGDVQTSEFRKHHPSVDENGNYQ